MPKTIVEDNIDILVAGAGLGGTGAAFEARYWGKNKKIVIAEKANIDRSGAVAQGLYAINCYMGTRFGENNPEDHVRYARIDLMGMVREHARSQVRLLFTRGTLADHDSR
jgi:adenylylsulfate reductase subunit A